MSWKKEMEKSLVSVVSTVSDLATTVRGLCDHIEKSSMSEEKNQYRWRNKDFETQHKLIQGNYTLTNEKDYESWRDMLMSGLKSAGWERFIDYNLPPMGELSTIDLSLRDRVRMVLNSHLSATYHKSVMHLDDPREMLKKLDNECHPTSALDVVPAAIKLFTSHYDPSVETVSQYFNRMEELVRKYNASGETFPELIKRILILMWMPKSFDNIRLQDQAAGEKGLSSAKLKILCLQHEELRAKRKEAEKASASGLVGKPRPKTGYSKEKKEKENKKEKKDAEDILLQSVMLKVRYVTCVTKRPIISVTVRKQRKMPEVKEWLKAKRRNQPRRRRQSKRRQQLRRRRRLSASVLAQLRS